MNPGERKFEALLRLFVFICVTVFHGSVEGGKKQSSSTIVIQNQGGGGEEEPSSYVITVPIPIPYRVSKPSFLIPFHQTPLPDMTRPPSIMYSGRSYHSVSPQLTSMPPPHPKPRPPLPPLSLPSLMGEGDPFHEQITAPPSVANSNLLNFYNLYEPWPPAYTVPRSAELSDQTIPPISENEINDGTSGEGGNANYDGQQYPQDYYPDDYGNGNPGSENAGPAPLPENEYPAAPTDDYAPNNEVQGDYNRDYGKDYPQSPAYNEDYREYEADNVPSPHQPDHDMPSSPDPPRAPVPPPPEEHRTEYENDYRPDYGGDYYNDVRDSGPGHASRITSVSPPSSHSSTSPRDYSMEENDANEFNYGPQTAGPMADPFDSYEPSHGPSSQWPSSPETVPKPPNSYEITGDPYLDEYPNHRPVDNNIDYGHGYDRAPPDIDRPVPSRADDYEYGDYRDGERRDDQFYLEDGEKYQRNPAADGEWPGRY